MKDNNPYPHPDTSTWVNSLRLTSSGINTGAILTFCGSVVSAGRSPWAVRVIIPTLNKFAQGGWALSSVLGATANFLENTSADTLEHSELKYFFNSCSVTFGTISLAVLPFARSPASRLLARESSLLSLISNGTATTFSLLEPDSPSSSDTIKAGGLMFNILGLCCSIGTVRYPIHDPVHVWQRFYMCTPSIGWGFAGTAPFVDMIIKFHQGKDAGNSFTQSTSVIGGIFGVLPFLNAFQSSPNMFPFLCVAPSLIALSVPSLQKADHYRKKLFDSNDKFNSSSWTQIISTENRYKQSNDRSSTPHK